MSSLRQGWDERSEAEIRLLRDTSIVESIEQWVRLQAAFEWQLQQTEHLYAEERREALAELQARLRRLVE